MSNVVLLGAGFSYALSLGKMPLTDTLGNKVADQLRPEGIEVPRGFSGGRFEMWLSRLAEPQPDLDEVTNAHNHALFLRISELIRAILLDAQNRTVEEPPLWAFQRLIGALHARRSTVATFNYDTLVERLIESQWRMDWETRHPVRGHHVIQDRPPRPYVQGMFGEGPASSFQLIKLHGSVDTFWVPGDTTGATINRLGYTQRWTEQSEDTETRRLKLPGRVPFIVPPAAAKSAFYANPFTRQLWRDASEALRSASTVDIVGYSLPATDLVTSGMLADTLAGSRSLIRVVNRFPDDVVDHLVTLGCDRTRIQVFDGDDAIAKYVDAFEHEFTPLVTREGQVLSQLPQRPLVMVGLNMNEGAAVTSVFRDSNDPTLARIRTEPIDHHSVVNRVREPAEHVTSLEELLGSAVPKRIVVEFDGGQEAAIVDAVRWLDREGHHDNWLRLLPAAMPATGP